WLRSWLAFCRVAHSPESRLYNNHPLYNNMVEQNCDVLERFINVVCLLGQQELSFRAHDESATSLNRGNYVEMAHFLSRYDDRLATHFSTASNVFTGLSNHIQNDIVQSVSVVILDFIKKEFLVAPFVAIMVNETSDISLHSQASVVLRYVDEGGKAQEQFVGFKDVSTDRSAKALADMFFEYLCKNKLVAQRYDGCCHHVQRSKWTTGSCQSQGYLQILSNFEFNFLLVVFSEIFQFTDVLYDILQTKVMDIALFIQEVQQMKNNIAVKLYTRDEFPRRNAAEIMLCLKKRHLHIAFSELYKLCGLVLIIPATTVSEEHSFSALKRIKTYSRSITGQQQLSGLALLSFEKGIMQKLQEKRSEFYDAIISEFTKKTHRLDFQFR
uniref:HAT C-terminal dimerisation domain-containing protein n=1 Tax=Latimeria chalumnae TaxID=7897 RepID=H2ZSF4_LATCH